MTLNPALFSSERGDWQTPVHIVEAVREFYGGRIDLDPCTTSANPVGADHFYTPATDGLQMPWPAGTSVYMNPPYGRKIGAWVDKALTHNGPVVMLLPARTDTKWFHSIDKSVFASYCFLRRRLIFRGAPAAVPFPSVLIHVNRQGPSPFPGESYPASHDRFGDVFSAYGVVL